MEATMGQIVGYIALLFFLLSFQRNKRTTLLLLMLTGIVLFAVSYALLHAWTGALVNLIEAAVTFVAYKKETKQWAKHPVWLYVFITLYLVTGLLTVRNWIDLLPVVAQIFGAIAVWQSNARAIRYFMLLPRPLWFTYNLVVGAQAGIIAEVLVFISIMVGIFRFDIRKQKER